MYLVFNNFVNRWYVYFSINFLINILSYLLNHLFVKTINVNNQKSMLPLIIDIFFIKIQTMSKKSSKLNV